MKQIPLGTSGLVVSEFCFGTMIFGHQIAKSPAHALLDQALEGGVTFWDTAEMYPTVSTAPETVGLTERIIGNWLATRGGRNRIVLATKIAGEGRRIRPGQLVTGATFRQAVEGSLARLQTDYIDLYQIHWPNRGSYHFRQQWDYAPTGIDRVAETANMTEILMAARELIDEGKIRAFGLSNETVWGTSRWLQVADSLGLPRVASVQNEYSLLCRQFDTDWAELSLAEDIPLLAYSPLATGILSGKYAGDVIPDDTRRAMVPDLGGRISSRVFPATASYLKIAVEHGLDPCQMAIAFCRSRPFATIPIIGASNPAQLGVDIRAAEVTLSDEVLALIGATHRQHPSPF